VIVSTLRNWWAKHYGTVLGIAIGLMVLAAPLRLGYESHRLLFEQSMEGAKDLRLRYDEVYRWFAGSSKYTEQTGKAALVYPPASYPMLWPFLGWLDFTKARWLWAITTVLMIAWLVHIFLKESEASTPQERAFIILLFLSTYPVNVTIGNGQLTVHLLAALLGGILILEKARAEWHRSLLAALLVLMSLVKPSIAAPFFWIVLFVSARLTVPLLVVIGYFLLSLLAASFQESGLITLLQDWMKDTQSVTGGYANLYIWLAALGLKKWSSLMSVLLLLMLGIWTHRHRHDDLWRLLGVTAIVARFWTYHSLYDDLLILFPIIALFRIAKSGPRADARDVVAAVLLGFSSLALFAPGTLYRLPAPWGLPFRTGQTIIWLLMLFFLLYHQEISSVNIKPKTTVEFSHQANSK
jgi:hypothetical protein